METLTHLFSQLTAKVQTGLNFIALQKTKFGKQPPQINPFATTKHQQAVQVALAKYCFPAEYDLIVNGYKRVANDPEAIHADFFNGDIPPFSVPKDVHYYKALEDTRILFAPPKPVKPVHFYDVYHHYPFKRKTNAEPPFNDNPKFKEILKEPPQRNAEYFNPDVIKDRVSTGDILDYDYFKELLHLWIHQIKDNLVNSDTLFFWMTLHVKTALIKALDPIKVRSIFGVPKLWIFIQVMFFWPLFNYYKENTGISPLLWGYETFNGGWFRLNMELFTSYMSRSFLMIDWKRFDKYARFSVCKDLFSVMRTFLNFNEGYISTLSYPDTKSTWTPERCARLQRLWDWSCLAFERTPVVLPDGWLYRRLHSGIPSGLYITQFLDSMYNTLMICTLLRAMGMPVNDRTVMKIMGDDSLIRLTFLIPVHLHDEFLATMQKHADHYFGSIISMDKSSMSNTLNGCEVLSYVNVNGLPHRDPLALLAQLYHTRARSPTPELTMAQSIGIYYASCGFSKTVRNVCHDLYNYYKTLGFTPNPSGLALALGEGDPFLWSEFIPLDHFPTQQEVQARLLCLDYKNLSQLKAFWNPDYFLEKM
jgi:hypothetical protein